MAEVKPVWVRGEESLTDYWLRLFDHKKEYGLNVEQITKLLNEAYGVTYREEKWRKDYRMFTAGREYERKLLTRDIAHRILCISDLHIPFELPVSTFARYKGCVDTLVLNGDITDCQSISSFSKIYRVNPIEEMVGARSYLIELVNFIQPKKLVVTYGNHDLRFQKYFVKQLDNELLELMPRTSLELILVDGFHHYDKMTGSKIYYEPLQDVLTDVEIEYTDNWWVQIGDAVFCHPQTFSVSMLKTAQKAMAHFQANNLQFNTLIMAHTHHIGMYRIGSVTLYEQGCCADIAKLDYTDGKLYAPQQKGFIYFGQDIHGITLPKTVRLESIA